MIKIIDKLRNCPKGTILWTEVFGNVSLVDTTINKIVIQTDHGTWRLDQYGRYSPKGECILWPGSGESWDDFTGGLLWNPKDLKPYDRVLVLHDKLWKPELFGGYSSNGGFLLIGYGYSIFERVIPYCDETKDLAGTSNSPEPGW